MTTPAVRFDGVWKKFRRGERHDSLRDLLPATIRNLTRTVKADQLQDHEFWALQDVSFEVSSGEAIGIIGPNGAGKSTTLKLLTRILRPTRGACSVRGRIGALIEVAAGFHPDLTGRENVFLQGSIMGMTRADIQRRMDEIIEFAGVAGFIDTQVKRYSSGMNARLGFSIAAHLDPGVLIIDEVLSVGDMAFQERCVQRMERFKRDGVAIVFVSHNLQAVLSLCDKAVLLQGKCLYSGSTDETIRAYISTTSASAGQVTSRTATIVLGDPRLMAPDRRPVTAVTPGQSLVLSVGLTVRQPVDDITVGFIVYRSTDLLIVYEGNALDRVVGLRSDRPGHIDVEFAFKANLTRGQYHIECYVLHNPTHEYLYRLSPAAMFSVEESVTCRGVADLGLDVSIAGTVSHAPPGQGAAAVRLEEQNQ